MRQDEAEGHGFDHAFFKTEITLFEDNPKRNRVRRREGFTSDFHMRLEARGSYYKLPGLDRPWGWGVHVDALEMGTDKVGVNFGVGAGNNYYEDIVMLPILNATNFQFKFAISF